MGFGGQYHAPGCFTSSKRDDTQCIEGWVGPRGGLDGVENLVPTGIRSPDRHSIDYAIPAHELPHILRKSGFNV
jgi:hypothetical protein